MTNLEANDKLIGDFTKPKMLFLDDRTKRIMSALKQYSDKYDVTIVTNAKECLRYLCQQEWDILSLDHDLNGDDFQDPGESTSGMEVVRYITLTQWMKQYKIPEIRIHSSNLFAANMMIDLLWEAGIKAIYRKFEYDVERCLCDSKVVSPPDIIPIDISWKLYGFGRCLCCSEIETPIDDQNRCRACFERELRQCRR